MTDLTDQPRLPDAYQGYRGNADNEAAYAAMVARLGTTPAPGAAPAPGAPPPGAPPATEQPPAQGGLERTRLTQPAGAAEAATRSTAPTEEMIQAEIGRLTSETPDKSKYANPEVARAQALQNLQAGDEGVPRGTAPAAQGAYGAAYEAAVAGIERTAADVGRGILDLPIRSIWGGVHGAFRGTLNLLTEQADKLDLTKWGMGALDWTVAHESDKSLTEGWHLLNGAERESFEKAGKMRGLGEALPLRPEDPKSVTGCMVKGVVQFTTSLAIAGKELEALGLPTQIAGFAGRGISAVKGFLAMFEGFDGASHRLSDLVQQVPSLRNPITAALASSSNDSPTMGRLKNAIEGSVLAQAADGLVHAIKGMRGLYAAHEAANAFVEGVDRLPPPPASEGLRALGAEPLAGGGAEGGKAPGIVEIGDAWGLPRPASLQGQKLYEAAQRTEGVPAEEISADRVPVSHEVGEVGDHTVRSPNGEITAQEDGKYLRVMRADVAEGARGKGEAIAMMERLQQEAEQRNLTLVSDKSVSEDAQRVYSALERRGYPITRNPAEESQVVGNEGGLVGKEGKPVFEVGPKAKGLFINFARIDGPEDIKTAMKSLADRFGEDIDAARRGVRTFQQTELGAQAEDAFKVLMERRTGDPLNAEQGLAARQLWASSAAKTMELAEIATKAPTVENLFAFRRMLTTHAAIQQEVIAARTETARALGAWRIPAGEDPLRLEQMVQSLSQDAGLKGGAETALTLAQKVRELATAQDYDGLGRFLEKSAYARTRDAVLEGYTNALLTAPLTHVKVTASNAATVALRIAERAVAARWDALMGNTDGVAMGEAAAQTAGLIGGFKDAVRFAGKLGRSWVSESDAADAPVRFAMPELGEDPLSNAIKAAKTGQYSLRAMGEPEYMQRAGAISSEALQMSQGGWVGNGIDFLGQIARTPGRALTAEHDFFRSIGYRMELNALAVRQATADVRAGTISEEALGSRVAEILENPPSQMRMDAVNGTLYQTFTDAPGKLAQHIGELRNDYPLLRVIIPFYKIPSRILAFTGERTPLAPAMRTFRDNMAAGGQRQSLALAQAGIGTLTMLATADYVLSGKLTGAGPADKGTRATLENEGWQPYSVKVGDRWVQYNRIEPTGSAMAMAADAVEAMQHFHAGVNGDDPDTANLALATTFAIANDITSKSYLQGLSNFFEAMSGDPQKVGGALKSEAGSLVPAGLAALDRVTDPNKREVYSLIDAIHARTPGWSESLPPLRGPWGEPVKQGSGMGAAYDLLSPWGTRPAANEPIDAELLRQQIDIPRVPSRTALHGVTLDLNRIDPKIYSRFQELAGNGYKGPDGLGLKDALNALVTGQHPLAAVYNRLTDGPDGSKADMLRDIVSEYRNGAKEQLLKEYPQLADMVREGTQAKLFLKTGGAQ